MFNSHQMSWTPSSKWLLSGLADVQWLCLPTNPMKKTTVINLWCLVRSVQCHSSWWTVSYKAEFEISVSSCCCSLFECSWEGRAFISSVHVCVCMRVFWWLNVSKYVRFWVLLDRGLMGCLCIVVCVCVCKWAQTSPAQSGLHQTAAGHFPPTSLTVPLAVGLGGGEDGFYLSPRMAYWLSNCRCCKEAWPSPSLTRLLCLTTSKVVSISLSLRVSTCLAVERREGNWVSL